jgi:hypothetical protein
MDAGPRLERISVRQRLRRIAAWLEPGNERRKDMKLKGPSMGDVKGITTEVAGESMEKVNQMVDELKSALALFEKFGFRAGKLKMEMGAMPAISTSISGSLDKVEVDSLQKLIEEHKDNKLLSAMVKGLIGAKQLRDRIELNYFTGTTLKVKLGVPPKISFDLQEMK